MKLIQAHYIEEITYINISVELKILFKLPYKYRII